MSNGIIVFVTITIIYAIGITAYLMNNRRNINVVDTNFPIKKNVVGESRFVLDKSILAPDASIGAVNEKRTEKRNIFDPANVPKHRRQIPDEELNDIFGAPPDGVANDPLDIDVPLYVDSFPENDADVIEEENEYLPVHKVNSFAKGVSFEEMGEAYRHMVQHNQSFTEEEKEQTGRILLELKHTDMFEAMVSGKPETADKINSLIESYLSAFERRTKESLPPENAAPAGFNVRNYV